MKFKKYMKSQKGSVPIALMVVFIVMGIVVSFSALYISEKANISFNLMNDVERFYEEDSIVEMSFNVISQVISEKEFESIEGEQFINSDDLNQIEEILNGDVLPLANFKDYQVFIEESYEPPTIDYFCSSDDEGINIECLDEPFELDFILNVKRNDKIKKFNFKFENLHAISESNGKKVIINNKEQDFSLSN